MIPDDTVTPTPQLLTFNSHNEKDEVYKFVINNQRE